MTSRITVSRLQNNMPHNAITRIITVTEGMERFWRCSHGWAPAGAAALLATARLDRQTSFTQTLADYLAPFSPNEFAARQILGYVTLRSLSEGVLKLFFAVWLEDYLRDPVCDRNDKPVPPEDVSFDRLICFYIKKIDAKHEVFLRRIQQRGNAIHHFTDRNIGTQKELIEDIIIFRDFLMAINEGLPYPDGVYNPN